MKTFASWLLFASAFIMLTACTQDDDLSLSSSNQNISLRTLPFSPCQSGQRILASDLPAAVTSYVASTYTNYVLRSIRRYDTQDGVRFSLEVEMAGPDVELLFNEAGEVLASGQSTSSQQIALTALPQNARDYLDANFAGMAIDEIKLKTNFGTTLYYVELVNSTDIYFTANGDLICVDLDDRGGSGGNGTDDNGGNNGGTDDNGGNNGGGHGSDDNGGDDNGGSSDDDDDDNDDNGGSNDDDDDDDNGGSNDDDDDDDDNGGGSGSDDDDDDDDDNGGGNGSDDNGGDDNGGGNGTGSSTTLTFNDLPESARNYVLANYNNAIVEEVKRQLLCNGTPAYKVGLEGPGLQGFYLFFSLSGDLLYTQRRIAESELPAEVAMALDNQFAAFQIDGNKISRQNFPDGSIRYEIRLRPNDGGEKRTVTFTPAGEVLCSYHD